MARPLKDRAPALARASEQLPTRAHRAVECLSASPPNTIGARAELHELLQEDTRLAARLAANATLATSSLLARLAENANWGGLGLERDQLVPVMKGVGEILRLGRALDGELRHHSDDVSHLQQLAEALWTVTLDLQKLCAD